MVKQCFKCGAVKSRDEFYAHPAMTDGLLGKCKECTRADVKAYRKSNPHKVRLLKREYARRAEVIETRRRWNANNPEKRRAIRHGWEQRNPHKKAAERKLNNAIRAGRMVRSIVCEECGSTQRIEAHHPDYSKPFEVQWLCSLCHGRTRHKENLIATYADMPGGDAVTNTHEGGATYADIPGPTS
jgi:hypothetical protein